jgi:hypothetical protein
LPACRPGGPGILDPAFRKTKLRVGIKVWRKRRRVVRDLEDRREVCLEEEVARLQRSGMSTREIARTMGVDEGWVEGLISMSADDDSSAEEHG